LQLLIRIYYLSNLDYAIIIKVTINLECLIRFTSPKHRQLNTGLPTSEQVHRPKFRFTDHRAGLPTSEQIYALKDCIQPWEKVYRPERSFTDLREGLQTWEKVYRPEGRFTDLREGLQT